MEARAVNNSDASEELCPKVLSNEQRKKDRANKRAAHLEQRKREDAERKVKVAEQQRLRTASNRGNAVPLAEVLSPSTGSNSCEDPVLRSNPALGNKIMAGVSGALAMARSYGVGGLDEISTTLIKESVRYSLSAAEDVRQHIEFTVWISCYILMSWFFPVWHSYILMIWINMFAVTLSVGQYFWPRKFSHGNSFLSKFCFDAREYSTGNRFAQGRVSQCFRVIFHVYTGFVNWLFLQVLERNGGTDAGMLPLWWLLQAVCFAVGQFALFETLYSYAAIISALTFLCVVFSWSIPMLLVVLSLIAFAAWCFSDSRNTQVATHTQKMAFAGSVGAWALAGLIGTMGWTSEFWAELPASISIQWSFVWTLIVVTIQSVLRRDSTAAALRSVDAMYWMASLTLFTVLLYIGYTPLIFIHMALVLKFVALPWIIDTMQKEVSAGLKAKPAPSPSPSSSSSSSSSLGAQKIIKSSDDGERSSSSRVVSSPAVEVASSEEKADIEPPVAVNDAVNPMMQMQMLMSNPALLQASMPMAMSMFRNLQNAGQTSSGDGDGDGGASMLRNMGMEMLQQAQQNPDFLSCMRGMAQQAKQNPSFQSMMGMAHQLASNMQENNVPSTDSKNDAALGVDQLD